jgi:Uma2 family endonuclease
MMAIAERTIAPGPEPVWEIAYLFPRRGEWTEEEYLALDTNYLVELDDGTIEVLPMPSLPHQRVALFLYRMLWAFVNEHGLGEVLTAPLPVRLWSKKFREPDILFLNAVTRLQQAKQYVVHPDLVMEVVSPDDPERDYEKKRQEYAQARIPEYWIVDPFQEGILVLFLQDQEYKVYGEFQPGERAMSKLLDGFGVEVLDVFAAAQ